MSVPDLRESSFLEMKYIAGNSLILVGCFGSSFYNIYCKGLMRRFQEIEILIFSYMTASHRQHSAADLGRAISLERVRGLRLEIVGRVSRSWRSSCMVRPCCSFLRRWSTWM